MDLLSYHRSLLEWTYLHIYYRSLLEWTYFPITEVY